MPQFIASFHRKAEALQRASEPGSCVSIACTLSEHLNARPSVAPKGETTHYDLRVAIAPSNHVRCARR